MEIYKNKEKQYFTNVRIDLISLIPKDQFDRILEIGAGGGDTLITIKEQKRAKEVVGIELNELEGSNQRSRAIDQFLFGNIESMAVPFPDEHFDVIICGDVLEHLIDPWKVLNEIQRLLKPGGLLITSIPNFRHYSVFIQIFLRGRFNYTEFGLFDKTHLRFFCKEDMTKMISSDRLKITNVHPLFDLIPAAKKQRILNKVTFRAFEEFLSLQFAIVAKKM